MEKLKDARGNCVSTYVPWLIHEEEEGKILFGDRNPARSRSELWRPQKRRA